MGKQQDLYNSFYNTRYGLAIDIDGVAGVQCVDLAKDWMQYVGFSGAMQALGGSGYAKEYYYRGGALGLTSFFYAGFQRFSARRSDHLCRISSLYSSIPCRPLSRQRRWRVA